MLRPARTATRIALGVLVLCGGIVFAATPATRGSPLLLKWIHPATGAKAAVELTGLDADELQRLDAAGWPASRWQEMLAVYAEPKGATSSTTLPAMLGSYRVAGSTVRFEPQFPLQSGIVYRAVFRPGGGNAGAPLTSSFELAPPPNAVATRVSAIYPSGDVLPENLLKFYLHFSAPMSGGDVYRHIHLRTAEGREVAQPFLQLGEELWSPDMTRLTVLLDPGRIKRGLRLIEEMGPALEPEKRYTLVIDRAWKDAAGQLLHETATKPFRVTTADRTPLDPTKWTMRPPAAGTRAPLEVAPGEALDRALALRLIRVVAANGAEIEGDAELTEHEQLWKFVPDAAWRAGDYRLVVTSTLEDLAGNNVGKPFDVDVFEKVDRRITSESVAVSFTVR